MCIRDRHTPCQTQGGASTTKGGASINNILLVKPKGGASTTKGGASINNILLAKPKGGASINNILLAKPKRGASIKNLQSYDLLNPRGAHLQTKGGRQYQ